MNTTIAYLKQDIETRYMNHITKPDPSKITITEWLSDYALFIYEGTSYVINYDKSEILELHGMVESIKDSGYGRYERHESFLDDPEWDDVVIEDIMQFIIENPKRWERDEE
jgi:hypothetical protein